MYQNVGRCLLCISCFCLLCSFASPLRLIACKPSNFPLPTEFAVQIASTVACLLLFLVCESEICDTFYLLFARYPALVFALKFCIEIISQIV